MIGWFTMNSFLKFIYGAVGVFFTIYGVLMVFEVAGVPDIETIAGAAFIAFGNTIRMDLEKC